MKTNLWNVGKISTVLWLAGNPLHGGETQVIRSGPERTALIELFTSEGCSSCPPADAWFSRLQQQKNLWKDFVPVTFHVDYWDGLGWPDPYARAEFTNRQRNYASFWNVGSVYTPDVVWNGQDWRGWSQAEHLPVRDDSQPGVLEAEHKKTGEVHVRFSPKANWKGGVVHVALLGSGLLTDVKRGENSGRKLPHDFVALDYQSGKLVRSTGGIWEADFPALKGEAPRLALAFWVESQDRPGPIQSAGGWVE